MGERIRMATVDDAAACVAIYGPVVERTAISFETVPPTVAEMADRIARSQNHSAWLVCEDAAGVAGYAYGSAYRARPAYDWTAETTVYVHERSRRAGVGTRIYRSLLGVLRRQGFRSAMAGITLPNEGSVRLHESMGFAAAGHVRDAGWKFGRWHDVGFWQLVLGEGCVPDRPVPASGLTTAERAALLAGNWMG